MLRGNLYIPSIDAKDLYLANNYITPSPYGYKLTRKDGSDNLNKYINSFDYSLDLIELRMVAERIYGLDDSLSFVKKNKEYSSKIINVTFKYNVCEFNRVTSTLYVRNGYNYEYCEFKDNYAVTDGQLVAIQLEEKAYNPIPKDLLPSYFYEVYDPENGSYTYKLDPNKHIKTVISSKNLRTWIYENGFMCNGIRFRRYKRSSGSARVGKCLFIDARLYKDMHDSEQCGLDVQEGDNLDIAGFEAYISLPTSSIIGTLEIKPENILIIDDYESTFKEMAVCTEEDSNGRLCTSEKEMQITNSIWDGQSLIDPSLMGKYATKGMVLLRNKFFKSCCFNTNIQQFFWEHNITQISQLKGCTLAKRIEDVRLITTPSSIKFYKFGDINTWFKHIYPYFGVVKYDKNTHFFDGRMVQAHYQLLNTLQLSREEVEAVVKEGLDYVSLINSNTDAMRYHLKFTNDNDDERLISNVMPTKNDVVYKMLNFDCGFENTKTYYDFKKDLIRSYLKNMKRGHILLNGTYATLFGNPYEMLTSAVGEFTGGSVLKPGEVHNIRYEYNKELLGSRSPHVTIGNILVTKNVACEEIDRYFNLTNNIICINSINENILERLSGSDFDSDTVLITDNPILINAAKKNYHIFKVPTRNVNPCKKKRKYVAADLAELDYVTSSNKIGDIVNLSQELNSLLWHIVSKSGESVEEQYEFIKEIYYDVCQLDVMSNIEIDKAKREFNVNNNKELDAIREKYASILTEDDGRKSMPEFLGYIAKLKNYQNTAKKNYKHYDTTMDYLHDAINKRRSQKSKGSNFIDVYEIFKPEDFNDAKVRYPQVRTILDMANNCLGYIRSININKNIPQDEKRIYINNAKDDFLYDLNKIKLNEHTMYRLMKQAKSESNSSLSNFLFYMLFNYKNDILTERLNKYPRVREFLSEDNDGEINIYGQNYKKK